MDLLTAISVRRSRRHYIDEPMTSILCDKLRAEADRLNAESGLDMRLVTDRHELFRGGFGLFQGARNAFLLAGRRIILIWPSSAATGARGSSSSRRR